MYRLGKVVFKDTIDTISENLVKVFAGEEITTQYNIISKEFKTLDEVKEHLLKVKDPTGWKVFKMIDCEIKIEIDLVDASCRSPEISTTHKEYAESDRNIDIELKE